MIFIRLMTVLAVMLVIIPGNTRASLVQLNYGDILPLTTENFDSAVGSYGSSGIFTGFVASVDFGNLDVANAGTPTCGGSSATPCLRNTLATFDVRDFSSFNSGTSYFGFELSALTDSNEFEVTVNGASGSAQVTVIGDGQYAFGDTAGLSSVTITNLGSASGTANYGIDNVITGVAIQEGAELDRLPALVESVPVPSSALMLGTVLSVFASLRKVWRRTA